MLSEFTTTGITFSKEKRTALVFLRKRFRHKQMKRLNIVIWGRAQIHKKIPNVE